MKKFVYQVDGFEFVDTVAFGEAWKEAKMEAAALHAPIYRLVIEDGKGREEVYVKSGCFLRSDLALVKNVVIF